MKCITIPVTLDGSGNGTANSGRPYWGRIAEIRSADGFVGSGTITVTRADDGGTILNVAPGVSGWSRAPMQTAHTTAGAGAADPALAAIPVDGQINVEIAGGSVDTAGTIHVYVG